MRTLYELRLAVLAALGFIDPFSNPLTATMAQLRERIRAQLGLAAPITDDNARTFAQLKADMYYQLGWAAQASSPPPGIDEQLGSALNEAQAILWRRIELDKGDESMPARMSGSSDACTVDHPLLLAYACGMVAAHLGKPEAKSYFDRAERYLADLPLRNPPGVEDLITTQLIEAQHTSYHRYAQASGSTYNLNAFAIDSDSTTIDHLPVYLLALANIKARLGQKDAELYYKQWEQYYAERERRMPANAVATVEAHLKSANSTLFYRYKQLVRERFFTWTAVSGQNMYELDENDEQAPGPSQCTAVLDPRSVTWAGVERDGIWYPLIKGIPPEVYSNNILSNYPARYEIRQCIEVWPAPGDEEQTLRFKGHSSPDTFATANDLPSVDDQAVFLLAVATCKPVFGQKDSAIFTAQLETYIQNVTAGLHQTARYLPGQVDRAVYVQPQPTVPFA